jgi:hypothetical protein
MKTQTRFRFHRFGDLVAFASDDTATLYVTPDVARRVAAELIRFADDCRYVTFSESDLSNTKVE